MLAPAIRLADGYAIDAQTANSMESNKRRIKQWKYSPAVFLPHLGEAREAPEPGEIFVQKDLAVMLRKLVDAERTALRAGDTAEERGVPTLTRFFGEELAGELVAEGRQADLVVANDPDYMGDKVNSRFTNAGNSTFDGFAGGT